MNYQEIYKGLNKKASAEQVKELAGMIKKAQLKKGAAGNPIKAVKGTLNLLQKGTQAVPKLLAPGKKLMTGARDLASAAATDLKKLPGAAKQILSKNPQGYLQGMAPSRMQRAGEALKKYWNASPRFRKGVKGTGAILGGYGLYNAGYGKGQETGANNTAAAAANVLNQAGEAVTNANKSLEDIQSKYKKEVGTGFWEGLMALLRRLFTGEGYAK